MYHHLVIRRLLPIAVLLMLIAAVACSSSSPTSASTASTSSAPFSQTDLVVGTGTQVAAGNRATVAYTGWLYDSSKAEGKGTQFDSGAAFTFTLGAGTVITKPVAAYALVVGNPGKQIGWMSEHGHRLHFNEEGKASCEETGEKYLLQNNKVTKINS